MTVRFKSDVAHMRHVVGKIFSVQYSKHIENIANSFYFIHKRNYIYQEQKLACASSEDSNESVDPHSLISFPPEETLDHCYMYMYP